MTGISYWEITLRLLLATGIGILFGFERKRSKKPVGVRTHVLVSLAACLVAIISAYGVAQLSSVFSHNITSDPVRLVVGILTGIGFIGAGIIWKTPAGVQGITTAAEIFLLSALGISIGLGLYFLTAVATVIAIIDMVADTLWENWQKKRAGKKRSPATEANNSGSNNMDYASNISSGNIADAGKMANDNKTAGAATIISTPDTYKEEATSS
ncbi:MAG: hypothetical protein HP052_00695 [Firmicutes bacterium]|nr:hypothetical protein [Bacillota bacterium]